MAHQDEVTSAQNDHDIDVDVEKANSDSKNPVVDYDPLTKEKETNGEIRELPNLQRRLKSRHLQMIAIGESSMSC